MGVDSFITTLIAALEDETFIHLTLGHYVGAEKDLKKVLVRTIILKSVPHLSFTWRYKTRDVVKNYTFEDGLARVEALLGVGFWQGLLCTTGFDVRYERHGAGKVPKIRRLPPSMTDAPDTAHDRRKKRMIEDTSAPWMRALGLTDQKGSVLKSAQDKFRQIHRYVELVAPLLKDWPREKPIAICDMGAGKGYLTFALYAYLAQEKYRVTMTGVEIRSDLVATCNRVARESGMVGLRFVEGTIAEYRPDKVDMLIALHACNTATDDAIATGIGNNAAIIVVAPCCHKQIRQEMEKNAKAMHPALYDVTRSGILLERQAEMATDHMRALILEYYGYDTKIFEFISDAHTPKNVMITGVLKNPARAIGVAERIAVVKSTFGIETHYLETLCPVTQSS